MTGGFARRRADLLGLAVIIVAAVCLFGPPISQRQIFIFRDHTDYFAPIRLYTAMHLRAGRLPLWNPYNGSGEQWLANPQSAVFYPPAWLFLLLPFAPAFMLFLLVHAVILGCGTWALLRLRAGPAASLVGSVALMFSGPVLSLLDVQNNFTTFAWVPWIVWRALRDRERPNSGRAAAALLALAFLGGEPFFAAAAALLYCIIVRRPKAIAIAGAGAIGVAAVQLFPFIELIAASDRVGGYFVARDVLRNSVRGMDWLRIVVPPRLMRSVPLGQQFIFDEYAGVLVCILAVIGVFVLLRSSRRAAAGWLLLLVCAALIASGPAFLASLPLTIFRYPSRVLPFAVLAIVAFAAAGWDRIRRGSPLVDALLVIVIALDLVIPARPLLGTAPEGRRLLAYPPQIGRNAKFVQMYGNDPLAAGSRVAWLAGYLNLHELRFTASTPAPLSPRRYTRLMNRALGNVDLLKQMGVMWVMVPGPMPPPFAEAAHVENVFTYRMPGALPMAYVRTRDGRVVAPRTLALDASRADVTVVTSSGGTLVLTQNDAPGWRVAVDGRAAEKKIAMETFRAVDIPPGAHHVTWTFRPPSLLLGAIVTMLALVWIAFGVRRPRSA